MGPSSTGTRNSITKKRSVDILSPVEEGTSSGKASKKPNMEGIGGCDLDDTVIESMVASDLDPEHEGQSSVGSKCEKNKAGETKSMRDEIGSCLKDILFGEDFKSLLNDHFRQSMELIVKDIDALKSDASQNKEFQKKSDAKFFSLEVRLDILEQHEKSTQLIIQNMWPESHNEDTVQLVLEYFSEALDMEVYGSSIVSCFRIGRKTGVSIPTNSSPINSETRHRPILVKFTSSILRDNILRARSRRKMDVKSKDTFINEDLTAHRRLMLNELRNLKREKKITDCWSSHGKIIYKTLQGRVVDATEKAREASTWHVCI